jgi:hypothetical protein
MKENEDIFKFKMPRKSPSADRTCKKRSIELHHPKENEVK